MSFRNDDFHAASFSRNLASRLLVNVNREVEQANCGEAAEATFPSRRSCAQGRSKLYYLSNTPVPTIGLHVFTTTARPLRGLIRMITSCTARRGV